MSDFFAVPCTIKKANEAVEAWHRHHSPLKSAYFAMAIACCDTGKVCAVAILGRPASNALEDGKTIEIRRLASDGTRNACSKLLALCRRACFVMGYEKIQTYTMPAEGGASLRAAGFQEEARTAGTSNFSSRVKPRVPGGKPRKVGDTARRDRQRQQGVKIRWGARRDCPFEGEVAWPVIAEESEAPPKDGLFKEVGQ